MITGGKQQSVTFITQFANSLHTYAILTTDFVLKIIHSLVPVLWTLKVLNNNNDVYLMKKHK